jgi:hypothetical protein
VGTSAGRTATAAAPDDPFHVTRYKKLIAALKKVTKPNVPAWLGLLPVPPDFERGERQELLVMLLLLRTLPFERRSGLLREARLLVEKTGAMSAATRRESFRFHRAALVRHAFDMPSLW